MVVSVSSSVSVHLGGDAGAARHLDTIALVRVEEGSAQGDDRAEVFASVALHRAADATGAFAQPSVESFAFSRHGDDADATVILAGARDAGGETFVHDRGDGDLTIPGFDFAADRLVLHGESLVDIHIADEVAQIHLADGSRVVLEALPRDPFG